MDWPTDSPPLPDQKNLSTAWLNRQTAPIKTLLTNFIIKKGPTNQARHDAILYEPSIDLYVFRTINNKIKICTWKIIKRKRIKRANKTKLFSFGTLLEGARHTAAPGGHPRADGEGKAGTQHPFLALRSDVVQVHGEGAHEEKTCGYYIYFIKLCLIIRMTSSHTTKENN